MAKKAKFKVGQVVAILAMSPQAFEKITSISEDFAAFCYRTESGDWYEGELRRQTDIEKGS